MFYSFSKNYFDGPIPNYGSIEFPGEGNMWTLGTTTWGNSDPDAFLGKSKDNQICKLCDDKFNDCHC